MYTQLKDENNIGFVFCILALFARGDFTKPIFHISAQYRETLVFARLGWIDFELEVASSFTIT